MNAEDEKSNAIETRCLGEQIYDYLCDRIIDGAYAYGDTLNIKLLAEQLNTSSMPVREAVKRLENEGVVVIKPRSTCYLKIPTKDSVMSALDMRELLEIHCIKSVYGRIDRDRLVPFDEILREMRKIVFGNHGGSRISEYQKWDRRFHTELCRLTANEYLVKFHKEISLHMSMSFIYDIAVPPDLEGTLADHKAIVEKLRENSPEAVTLLKSHLHKSRRNVVSGRLFLTSEGE